MYTEKIKFHDVSGGIQDVTLAEDIKDSRARVHVTHTGSSREHFSERVRLGRLLEQQYHCTWSLGAVEERLELCRESLLLLLKGAHDGDQDPALCGSRTSLLPSVNHEATLTEL